MTTDLFRYVDWQIERQGEIILWGEGILFVDVPDFEADGYRVQILEEGIDWSEIPARCWMLTDPEGYPDPSRYDFRGFAIGDVQRKMVPEITPDITAAEMAPAEGFNGRLLGPPHV